MALSRFSGKEIEDFCSFLSREYGLSFPPARYSFVENRIEPLMADFSCRTLSDIILRARRDLKLRMDLLNNLTTNETWFSGIPNILPFCAATFCPSYSRARKRPVTTASASGLPVVRPGPNCFRFCSPCSTCFLTQRNSICSWSAAIFLRRS